jgi:nucleoside-diphosphate-sugar epimerase
MAITQLIRSRIARGLSLFAIGPNEARIVYDFVATAVAAAMSWLFAWQFASGVRLSLWWIAALPFLLVGANALLGVYSRFRRSNRHVKTLVLLAAVLVVGALSLFAGRDVPFALLWAMVVMPLLALPRLFLGIAHDKRAEFTRKTILRDGPVLLIGGAGYIGTHVVNLLLREGRTVRVLDRLTFGREAVSAFEGHRNFALIEGEATDISKLAEAMDGASAVVQLAGLVGDPACAVDSKFTRHANIIVTRMAKEVAQALGVHRFIFASSCSVYGVSEYEVKEEDALNPVSLYAQTKIDSERELLFSVRDEFFVTVLRFATVFGHSWRPRFDLVANLFTAQAMNDGLITVMGPDQWRPFVHVRDLARAVTMVLNARPAVVQGQIFNVGDPRLNMTILQLAEAVKRLVENEGKQVRISVQDTPQDRRNYRVGFDRIREILGFQAQTSMDDGLREIVETFKRGGYRSYRDPLYSNVAMTKKALVEFRDPARASRLYAPLEADETDHQPAVQLAHKN